MINESRFRNTFDAYKETQRIRDKIILANRDYRFVLTDNQIDNTAIQISDEVKRQFDRSALSGEERESLIIMDRLKGISSGVNMNIDVILTVPGREEITIRWESTIIYD